LEAERSRREQMPPQFSAIKYKGRPAHRLARRGEAVPLARRPVAVYELCAVGSRGGAIDLLLHVSKGYYVRALARDLGQALGVPAHLSALRRTASDPFTLSEARSLDDTSTADLQAALESPEVAACRVLPACVLTVDGARRAFQG